MKLAAIRIRGITGVKTTTATALDTIHLGRKFHCIVLEDNPCNRGQLEKCKDFITYGAIDAETETLLVQKRGKKDKQGKLLPFFTLNPPRGGFERKGIKVPTSKGGALGQRKNMGDLLKKMV
ncbi:MAG: uL30 family ribosomal protein [archaeon]